MRPAPRSGLRAFLTGPRVVLPASLTVQALGLARTIIVARLLGPEQFGLAVTFILIQQFLDASTDAGLNKYILQNRFGDRTRVQRMVQAMALSRGAISAALVLLVGYPLFVLFDGRSDPMPFLILALIPAAMGMLHADTWRMQRRGRFINDSASQITAELVCFAVTVILVMATHSYIAVLAGLAARAITVATMSHVMSRRRYSVGWSRALAPSIWRFSWPLLINGPLVFIGAQADRMFTAAILGARELGIYSAATMMLASPTLVLMRVLGSIFTPRLSKALRASPQAFRREESVYTGFYFFTFLLIITGFAAVGPMLIIFLYGPAYAQSFLAISLIGCIMGVRFLRGWSGTLAIVAGATRNVLVSNILRFLSPALGLATVLLHGGMEGLLAGFLVGEVVTIALSILMLNRTQPEAAQHRTREFAIVLTAALVLPAAVYLLPTAMWCVAIAALAVLLISLLLLHLIDRRLLPRDLRALGW